MDNIDFYLYASKAIAMTFFAYYFRLLSITQFNYQGK